MGYFSTPFAAPCPTVPSKELHHWEDPTYDRQVRQLGHDEHVCDVEMADGTPRQFKGTLQQLGSSQVL